MNIISTDTEAQSKNFNGVYHKTRKGEIVWRCAGQVEHTSECQSRTIKQAEIDEYTRSILQIDTETIDTNSLIEKITVDKNAFKIIVDSTVLS